MLSFFFNLCKKNQLFFVSHFLYFSVLTCFWQFDHKLGSGAFKTVYRALDTERGIEVAWNQVLTDRVQLDKEKVLREIEFFKKIRHKHIIEFYNFWTTKNQVVFITELMPSGTLTE